MLILCSPLCFSVNKLNKYATSLLKGALLDFYSVDALADARQRLIIDARDICVIANMECLPVPDSRIG